MNDKPKELTTTTTTTTLFQKVYEKNTKKTKIARKRDEKNALQDRTVCLIEWKMESIADLE